MSKTGTCLAVTAILASFLTVSSATATGVGMSVGWVDWNSSQDDCVKKASQRVKANSFTSRFEVLHNRTIYGDRGDYTAAVRCVADKSIAFIAVAGPKSDTTSKYLDAIREDFSD